MNFTNSRKGDPMTLEGDRKAHGRRFRMLRWLKNEKQKPGVTKFACDANLIDEMIAALEDEDDERLETERDQAREALRDACLQLAFIEAHGRWGRSAEGPGGHMAFIAELRRRGGLE
jgi:hypothetical protein